MRILSQNKKITLPIELIGISINYKDNREIIAYGINSASDEYFTLGKYESIERTEEVFFDILNCYEANEEAKIYPELYQRYPIYWMPKK